MGNVICGVDENGRIYPICIKYDETTGLSHIMMNIGGVSETQIFDNEVIRDTDAINSAIGDCRYFNIITIWVENGLDQNVSVQIKGNRVNSVTGAVDIGTAFTVNTVDREARTMEPTDEGFLPFIFVEITAAVIPTTGNLDAYLIKKPI